jgi:hypothetical protein
MSRLAFNSTANACRIWCATGVVVICIRISGFAGVGLPPMPDPSDTNAMEQYRIAVLYEAQKSGEERLRVGKERYELMLSNKASVLQVMAGELAERQKSVVLQTTSPAKVEKSSLRTQNITLIGVVATGLAFLGFRHYLNRQESKNATTN